MHQSIPLSHPHKNPLFIHAGVVQIQHKILLLPGRSGTGKSSLTHALVQQGAVYYSDEYAAVSPEGYISPMLKPIMLRNPQATHRRAVEIPPEQQGFSASPVGTVLLTHFAPESVFQPVQCPSSTGFTALLDNCINMRDMPTQGLSSLKNLLAHAQVFSTLRGDTDTCAKTLYDWVAQQHGV